MKKNTNSKLKELNLFLSNLENKHSLYEVLIDDWCIWPVIRSYVSSQLLDLNWDTTKKSTQKMSLLEKISHITKHSSNLIRLQKAPVLVKTFTSALRGQNNGHYKDIFVDDLLLQLNKSDFVKLGTMANTANYLTYLKRNRHALVPEHADSYTLEAIASGISNLHKPQSVRQAAETISNIFKQEEALSQWSSKQILHLLSIFYWTKLLYRQLILRVSPKYVLISNHSQFAMTAAAKECGVCVIEMQHGSPNHLKTPYSWPEFAAPYKNKLPLPDKIFLFGDYFKEALMTNGFWDEELVSMGSLQFDAHRNSITLKRNDVVNILVTTQGIDADKICTLLNDFLQRADGTLSTQIYIKLHPNYDSNKQQYEIRLQHHPNVSILQNAEGPTLYELFHTANCHLSIYSTTHFESLALGVPTIILPFTGYEQMLSLVNQGHAEVAQDADWLLSYLLENRGQRVAQEIGDYYFRSDAVNNMCQALGL